MEHRTLRLATSDRRRQCVKRHGEVWPSRLDPRLSDVSQPQLVDALGRRGRVHQIRGGLGLDIPLRRARLDACAPHPLDVQLPHQRRHPFAAHPLAIDQERRVAPRTAIGIAVLDPLRQDPALELGVAPCPRLRQAPQSVVVPTRGEIQHPQDGCRQKHGQVRLHDHTPLSEIDPHSLAKHTTTSLRVSGTIPSGLFSRFGSRPTDPGMPYALTRSTIYSLYCGGYRSRIVSTILHLRSWTRLKGVDHSGTFPTCKPPWTRPSKHSTGPSSRIHTRQLPNREPAVSVRLDSFLLTFHSIPKC